MDGERWIIIWISDILGRLGDEWFLGMLWKMGKLCAIKEFTFLRLFHFVFSLWPRVFNDFLPDWRFDQIIRSDWLVDGSYFLPLLGRSLVNFRSDRDVAQLGRVYPWAHFFVRMDHISLRVKMIKVSHVYFEIVLFVRFVFFLLFHIH